MGAAAGVGERPDGADGGGPEGWPEDWQLVVTEIIRAPHAYLRLERVAPALGWDEGRAAEALAGLANAGVAEITASRRVSLSPWGAARLGLAVRDLAERNARVRSGWAPASVPDAVPRVTTTPLGAEPEDRRRPRAAPGPARGPALRLLRADAVEPPAPTVIYLGGANPYREIHAPSCRCDACQARWRTRVSATRACQGGPRPARPLLCAGRVWSAPGHEVTPAPPAACPGCGDRRLRGGEYCLAEDRDGRERPDPVPFALRVRKLRDKLAAERRAEGRALLQGGTGRGVAHAARPGEGQPWGSGNGGSRNGSSTAGSTRA